jgi:uncharacterized alpha-E superfamily protein
VHRGDLRDVECLVRLHGCLAVRHSKLPKTKRTPVTFKAFEREMGSLLSDAARYESLPSTLAEVSRIGGNVRERLSADMTLLLVQLRDKMNGEKGATLVEYQAKLTGCLELLSAFSGMERENLIRGSGWLFLSLGRRLERAIYLVRQLRVITRHLAAENWSYLECLLEVADSSVTYRARYYTTLQPLAVLDVLLADETNPRSLNFQLDHLVELYEKLPRHDAEDLATMRDALARLRTVDLQGIVYASAVGRKARGEKSLYLLDKQLAELEGLLPRWSNHLSSRYFSHARTLPVRMGEG